MKMTAWRKRRREKEGGKKEEMRIYKVPNFEQQNFLKHFLGIPVKHDILKPILFEAGLGNWENDTYAKCSSWSSEMDQIKGC